MSKPTNVIEARNTWCPMTVRPVGMRDGQHIPEDRKCVAMLCAVWVDLGTENGVYTGYCGLRRE